MARTRSVLIDNTLGRIFRNVQSTATANAANLIAGSKIESTGIISAKKVVARVSNNIGNGKGLFFAGGALVTSITLTTATPPAGSGTGSALITRVKVGSSYETAQSVGDYSLTSRSATISTVITVAVGHSVYFDIIQVGSIKPGIGFGVRLNFYRG